MKHITQIVLLGLLLGSYPHVDDSAFPIKYEIDYVKVYQK